MFDIREPGFAPGSTLPVADTPAPVPGDPAAVPLERLEEQICELAGHLTAATCRFLVLLADFDARRGWASWDMNNCAQWLSWKCQMSSGTAREHVRVARALRDLPVIRAGFAAARLSYAKVRALTRIATPNTEAGLAELAGPMTGNQLERFARAHRQASRCHVEDGPAISVSTAQMLGCTAALSWMAHDRGGSVLRLGRRRRRPNAALRRAARERDTCRCRFPGCESRRIDLHHIQFWSNGGRTDLENLISLCKYHHMLVHDRGYLIATARDGTFAFYRSDGTAIPPSPALPAPGGTIADCHDAGITPETIIPPWYGEKLDLDHAIYVCFANARTARERQAGRDQAGGARGPGRNTGLRTRRLGRPDQPVLRRTRH